jgi:hypothetical protein
MVLSILQANNLRSTMGQPIPTVIHPLADRGCHLRAGEVSLWGAGSGTGKSVLVHWIATYASVPALYFSADSNDATMRMRTGAMLSGLPQAEVWEQLEAGQGPALAALSATAHISWVFDSSPTLEDIEQEVAAFHTAQGTFPRLIVVDNLRNVTGDSYGDEYRFWDEVVGALHDMARFTEAHVAITHHVTGQYASGSTKIPLNGLENKVDKRAEVVITAFRPSEDIITMSIVKNRGGQARGDGTYQVAMGFDGARMQLAAT